MSPGLSFMTCFLVSTLLSYFLEQFFFFFILIFFLGDGQDVCFIILVLLFFSCIRYVLGDPLNNKDVSMGPLAQPQQGAFLEAQARHPFLTMLWSQVSHEMICSLFCVCFCFRCLFRFFLLSLMNYLRVPVLCSSAF